MAYIPTQFPEEESKPIRPRLLLGVGVACIYCQAYCVKVRRPR